MPFPGLRSPAWVTETNPLGPPAKAEDPPISGKNLIDLEERNQRSFLDARKWVGFTATEADRTTQLQQAIGAAQESGPGATLVLPPWLLTAESLTATPGLALLGHGQQVSGIRQATGVSENVNLLVAKGSSTNPAENFKGLSLRHLQLRGRSDTDPFNEHVHLLALSGVSNVTAESVLFKGFRGDGVYLGSGLGAESVERHNEVIRLINCEWDGIGKNNRNGISVIDATDLIVFGGRFHDCTKSTMPGAIDIEPNSAYNRLRDLEILFTRIVECGGNAGDIGLYITKSQAELTTPMQGLRIGWVTFRNSENSTGPIYLSQTQTPEEATVANDIDVEGCKVFGATTKNPLQAEGIKGLRQRANTWEGEKALAYGNKHKAMDVEIHGDTFRKIGTAGGTAIEIYAASGIRIYDPLLDHIGKEGERRFLSFSAEAGKPVTSSGVEVYRAKNVGPALTAFAAKAAEHTTEPATNIARENKVGNVEVPGELFQGGSRSTTIGIVAASKLTLPADGDTFVVTGKTEITEITPSWVGRIVSLRLSEAVKIKSGGNVNLYRDFVADGVTPWKTLTLRCIGSEWEELAPAGLAPGRLEEVASAESMTIGYSATVVKVTGTAEIKKIPVTFSGHAVTLLFASTAKLVKGEDLLLKETVTPGENAAYRIVCDGVRWVGPA